MLQPHAGTQYFYELRGLERRAAVSAQCLNVRFGRAPSKAEHAITRMLPLMHVSLLHVVVTCRCNMTGFSLVACGVGLQTCFKDRRCGAPGPMR